MPDLLPQTQSEVRILMNAIVGAIQDVVTAQPDVEVRPDPTQADDAIVEARLEAEISTLWTDHTLLSQSHKKTAVEIRHLRARLAERLFEMKKILSRPGRGGEWRGWLRERGIPRSTADRLVARHGESLGVHDGNAPSESIPEPAEASPEKVAKSVWRSVQRVLTTDDAVVAFITYIAELSGIACEQRQEGLFIFDAVGQAAADVPIPASTTDPGPQPSHGDDTNKGEPATAYAMDIPTAEQTGAVADAGAGSAT